MMISYNTAAQKHGITFTWQPYRAFEPMTLLQRLLQTFKWTTWIACLAIFFGLAVYFDKQYQSKGKYVLSYVVWAAFLQAYMVMMLPLGIALKRMIYGLANPPEADAETDRIARFISIAIIFGITFILGLLGADYVGHTRAAERAVQEKNWEKEDAAPATPPALPNQVEGKKNSAVPPASASESTPQRTTPTLAPQTPEANKSVQPPPTWIEKTGGFLGTFGDFFGGVLNPILTFGTLIALAITVLMQRVQLKEARSETKRSGAHEQTLAFETTFFNMLNLHAENARHLTFDPAIIPTAHPMKLNLMRRVVYLAISAPKVAAPVKGRAVFAEILSSTARGASRSEPQLEVYRMLQVEHNDVLGHYFRHLYQILDHIDRLNIDDQQVDFDTRKRYSNILRAQLSSHELSVLMLNCVELMVDNGSFKEKVVRYQLLEHLPVYKTEGGELRARGINPDSEAIFFQYFDVTDKLPSKWTSGAFGENPAVAAYLEEQESPSWSKPRPQPKSKKMA
jgi:hypothetical protein